MSDGASYGQAEAASGSRTGVAQTREYEATDSAEQLDRSASPLGFVRRAALADLAVNVAGSFIVYLADVVPAASESDETV